MPKLPKSAVIEAAKARVTDLESRVATAPRMKRWGLRRELEAAELRVLQLQLAQLRIARGANPLEG